MIKYIIRECSNCGKKYRADKRNIKRGWGLCCSKSCAEKLREKNKPGYDKNRVKINNIRREYWNEHFNRLDDDEGIDALGIDFLSECGDRD